MHNIYTVIWNNLRFQTDYSSHPSCKATHSVIKKWPYKRGDLSWGGQFTNILLSHCILTVAWKEVCGLWCESGLIRGGTNRHYF
jgi:hypothetical protein